MSSGCELKEMIKKPGYGDRQAALVDGIYPRDHSAQLKAGSSAWCELCRIFP